MIIYKNIPKDQALDSAFPAIGLKYTERFINKQVWCPEYKRFYGDRELGDYAKSIGKFYFAENARIVHLHPGFTGEPPDNTHNEVRKYLNKDRVTYFKRQQKSLLWGRDFQLERE